MFQSIEKMWYTVTLVVMILSLTVLIELPTLILILIATCMCCSILIDTEIDDRVFSEILPTVH